MDDKSRLCFEAQVDGNSPNAQFKRAHAKLVQLKEEVDFHMRSLLADMDLSVHNNDVGSADASILETLKQLAHNFLESTAASLPHKEYLYKLFFICFFILNLLKKLFSFY